MQLFHFFEIHRQEYLGMQTKYHALESRSKELLISQSSAVSGASVALSGLGNRLELLVEQLITSYNISERDLEVSGSFFDVDNDFRLSHCSKFEGIDEKLTIC